MNHRTVILLVYDNPVNHDQRLTVAVQGVDTVHHHEVSDTGRTSTGNRTDISTQLITDFGCDIQGRTIIELVCHHRIQDIVIRTVCRTHGIRIHRHIAQLTGLVNTHTNRIIVRCRDFQCRSVLRHIELIRTVLFGQRTVTVVTAHADQGSTQRSAGCHSEHSPADRTCLYIFLYRTGRSGRSHGVGSSLFLSIAPQSACHQQC